MHDMTRALVAVIGDDPLILHIIWSTLKPFYDVRPFASGPAFLKFFASEHVDLALLDCAMSGTEGFAVMDQLHKDMGLREPPFLLLTGRGDRDNEALAFIRGAADFVSKPIDPRALLTRVRHQLELHHYRRHMNMAVEEKIRDFSAAYDRLRFREEAALTMLAVAADKCNQSSGEHIQRITDYVRLIVQELLDNPNSHMLTQEQANDIIKAAKLHDVGKIVVSDRILGKKGKLTVEELEDAKGHTVYGALFLDTHVETGGGDPFLAIVRDIVLHHHEKWDGTGYPFGLQEWEIPLAARILAIADAYDDLITTRFNKKALTHEEAAGVITDCSGTHFDPYLVKMFVKCSDSFWGVAQSANEKS